MFRNARPRRRPPKSSRSEVEREETEEGRAPVVDQALGLAMNLSCSPLDEIATVMDHLVLDVPTELSDHALHGFMNELGLDLLGRFQAPTFPAQEIEG
jgi:hypothetical protein